MPENTTNNNKQIYKWDFFIYTTNNNKNMIVFSNFICFDFFARGLPWSVLSSLTPKLEKIMYPI